MELTWLPEGLERFLKKGKSSEFNPRNDGLVKSSPAGKVCPHESSNLYPKIGKKIGQIYVTKIVSCPDKFSKPNVLEINFFA